MRSLEAGLGDPPLGQVALLGGDRRRRHPAAVLAGRVDREAAPAAADLEQVVLRARAAAASQIRSSFSSCASSKLAPPRGK